MDSGFHLFNLKIQDDKDMNIQSRKEFLKQLGLGTISGLGVAPLLADPKKQGSVFTSGFRSTPSIAGSIAGNWIISIIPPW